MRGRTPAAAPAVAFPQATRRQLVHVGKLATPSSTSPSARDHGRHGLCQYSQIRGHTLRFDVLDIELHLPLEIDLGPATHLPNARDARFHREAPPVGL